MSSKPVKDDNELPHFEGMKASRVDDGRVALEIDPDLISGFALAGLTMVRAGKHPSAIVLAMIDAAWLLLDITSDHPVERRRDMLVAIINGMAEQRPSAKDTVQ